MLEKEVEDEVVQKLADLKYVYRDDIIDQTTLDENFCTKFEALNHVILTENEFDRFLEEIIPSMCSRVAAC